MRRDRGIVQRFNSCWLLIAILAANLGTTACSKNEPQPARRSSPTIAKNGPSPPLWSSEHLESALLDQREVATGMRQSTVAVSSLQKKQAPMCSLTGTRFIGRPQIITRQFANPTKRDTEPKYAQIFGRYNRSLAAEVAYTAIKKRAENCPKKQHVPPKRLPGNFVLFEHDDTWRISSDRIGQWTHLRGFEKHVEPESATKRNVFYFIYDYAFRGNVLVATLYWERTEISDRGKTIAERATNILTKQLTKIG